MKLSFKVIHIKDWNRTDQSLLDKEINVKKSLINFKNFVVEKYGFKVKI